MGRDTCYFDGRCGMCRRTTTILSRLDWLGKLEFADMTQVSDLPVPMETAMQGMPMRTASGRILVGFEAARRALSRTPIGLLPGMILYIPIVSTAGRAVYNHIAVNRRRDGVCQVTN